MKTLIATLGLAATVALPFAASAQTMTTTSNSSATTYQYQYVDTSGQIQTINAVDATTALNTAPNLALHSGVIYVANSTQALPNNRVSL